jgi:hypothetical protein
MAKNKDHFSNFDSPYETQPPKGSAEPGIDYGGVAQVASDEPSDTMGVLPVDAKPKNIGPSGGEGH